MKNVAIIDSMTGEVMPAGDRGGWTDDEWRAYIAAADPGEAIKHRAMRIYQFREDCPRCQGGSHFAGRMKEWFNYSRQTGGRLAGLGEELAINDSKFSKLSIADDWNSWCEVATADDAVLEKLRDEGGIIDRKRIKAAKKKHQKEVARAARALVPVEFPSEFIVGDFREHAAMIADDSVDLIFTDPPYLRETGHLYGDAAKEAARILKPGGSMLAYCGAFIMPEALDLMRQHLRYWWTCAVFHSGNRQYMNEYGIIVGWKPILWMVKGTRGDRDHMVLDVVTGDREKDHHEWQQAEAEAEYYIKELTEPGDLVVDFFAGGGTTPAVAKRLGRRWITFEIDEDTATAAATRINATEVDHDQTI